MTYETAKSVFAVIGLLVTYVGLCMLIGRFLDINDLFEEREERERIEPPEWVNQDR